MDARTSSTGTTRKLRKPTWHKVTQVQPGGHGYNLKVKVLDLHSVLEKQLRPGRVLKIAESRVADDSGTVILTIRNEQIAMIKPGTYIALRNCKIEMYQGFIRVSVDRWGKIVLLKDDEVNFEDEEINESVNVSSVEYELVQLMAGPMDGVTGVDHHE